MAELAPPLDEDAIKQLVPFNELLRQAGPDRPLRSRIGPVESSKVARVT